MTRTLSEIEHDIEYIKARINDFHEEILKIKREQQCAPQKTIRKIELGWQKSFFEDDYIMIYYTDVTIANDCMRFDYLKKQQFAPEVTVSMQSQTIKPHMLFDIQDMLANKGYSLSYFDSINRSMVFKQ